MKPLNTLEDLMYEQLRITYDGEMRLKEELPEICLKVSDKGLKGLMEMYLEEQDNHIWRLRQVFELLYQQKRGEKCKAIKAMLQEANDIIERSTDAELTDAGVITALQHIIHYQIAGYGAISNYANTLGLFDVAGKIHLNLEENKSLDRKLAILAEESINLKAKES